MASWKVCPRGHYPRACLTPLSRESFCFFLLLKSVRAEPPESAHICSDPDRPTVIYFHGNAATRAASNRVRTARHLTDLGANFVIIDYRGFADSTRLPPPSEEGLLVDARRVWDYVNREKGVPAERIAIMGQSLGTGVSAGLAGRLAKEGELG